ASAARDDSIEALKMWGRYSLRRGVAVAERVLAGELAAARGDREAAVAALREAVALEDAIPYDEPPGWHAPVRHTLGAVLLDAGQGAEAEAVYREELRRNPENGWSLRGLAQALAAQGKDAEASEADERFETAWSHADFALRASCLWRPPPLRWPGAGPPPVTHRTPAPATFPSPSHHPHPYCGDPSPPQENAPCRAR